MKTYFEKDIKIKNLYFYANINFEIIVWLPTFANYKLESIVFSWLCFSIGVNYIND
jgi:hypothetical protein